MCNDLLPENINAFLDDVETGLCLPILLLIVLCTLQFIVNHTLDIACTIGTAAMNATSTMESTKESSLAQDCMQMPLKLKGMLSHIGMRLGAFTDPQLDPPATVAKNQRSRDRMD